MRNTILVITIPHLFSPTSVFSEENKSYIFALRSKYHETLQINESNFLFFNNAFVQVLWISINTLSLRN